MQSRTPRLAIFRAHNVTAKKPARDGVRTGGRGEGSSALDCKANAFLIPPDFVFIDRPLPTPLGETRPLPRANDWFGSVPHGHCKTSPCVSTASRTGWCTLRGSFGPMTGRIFLPRIVEQCWLRRSNLPVTVVIMDNPASHKAPV